MSPKKLYNTFIILFRMRKILCLFTVAIVLISCGKKSAESYYIPKDAIAVMYVNLESLSKKSNDVDFKNLAINKMIDDQAPKEFKDFMNTQMTAEKINATFRKEFILGFASIDRMSGFGGLILPIKDGKSFQDMIQPLLDKMPMVEKQENVGKGKAFTVYSTDEFAIGWSNETALVIGAKSYAGTALIDLTELDKSKSVYATDYYKDFFDKNKDMGLHLTSTPVGSVLNSFMSMTVGLDVDLENNNMTYYGNFEDDNIHTETKLKLNNDFKSLIGYTSWMTTDYNTSLLNAIPENPTMLVKFSMNPVALYKHVESLQNNKVLPMEVRDQLKEGIQKMNQDMKREVGMTGDDLAQVFEGSMLFALTEGKMIKDTIYSYNFYDEDAPEYEVVDKKIPYYYTAVAIKDLPKFETLMGIVKEKENLQEKGKDYYQIDSDVFVVVKNNVLFITNNELKADELFSNGKLTANLSNFTHKSNLSHTAYIYTDSNFYEMYSDLMPNASSFSPYGAVLGNLSKDSGKLYKDYFGENHYFMDVDGTETFMYTKGEGNSLVRMIMYSDAMVKQYEKLAEESY